LIKYLNVSACELFARLQLALKVLMLPNYANTVYECYIVHSCEVHLV